MMIRRAGALLISVTAILLISATSAAAKTGPAWASPAEAGYAFGGAHFEGIQTWVKLPDAARYAGYVGQVTVSAQLWTSDELIDVTATACTDSTCQPGGTAQELKYRRQLAVYRLPSATLVCSTSAAGSQRCPGVPQAWSDARMPPGQLMMISLGHPSTSFDLFTEVGNQAYQYPVSQEIVFVQARFSVEFGATPWAAAAFRAPRTAIRIAEFDRLTPPPYAAEITTVDGSGGGFDGWWTRHEVPMTSGASGAHAEAAPGRLWDDGNGFTVYLEP